MDSRTVLALCGLIISSSYLSLTFDKSYTVDRPVHTSAAVLAISGIVLVAWNKVARLLWRRTLRPQEYTALPLEELRNETPTPRSPRPRSPLPRSPVSPSSPRSANGTGFLKSPKGKAELAPMPSLKKLRITCLCLVTAICCRVKLLLWLAPERQCAGRSYACAIPLMIAIHDFWTARKHEPSYGQDIGYNSSRLITLWRIIAQSRFRFILPTACLVVGSALVVTATSPPRSTYICAGIFASRAILPFFQALAAVLDFIIIICIVALINRGKSMQPQETRSYSSIGWALICSSFILALSGTLYVIFRPEFRPWAFTLSFNYIRSLCAFSSAALLFVLCALYAFDGVGALTTSVIVAFICSYSRDFHLAWTNSGPYPPTSTTLALFSICLYVLSMFWYTRIEMSNEDYSFTRTSTSKQRLASTRLPGWMSILVILLLALRIILAFSNTTQLSAHPIDKLIENANTLHQNWQKKAAFAESLSDVVSQYRIRYHRPPPPMFDIWFEWAKKRRSLIMNDYNQIHDDLVPFWGMDPREIRQQTWDMISNPANDVGGIIIRGGRVSLASNVLAQHKHRLEGVVGLVNKFAQYLPDMDLAINVIDSPRVAMPYDSLKFMRQAGLRNADDPNTKENSFSGDRGGQWQVMPSDPIENPPIFEDHAGHPVFTEWGSVSCPTMSAARFQRNWDLTRLCTTCVKPHSDRSGAFVSNWTLSQDPCHQPDLAFLHGIYVSSPSFRVHHNLLPVFSQTKVQGFQDILYPSAEEYTNTGDGTNAPKEEHSDLPFSDKEPTLFFRGETSEGITLGNNAWRSFLRQRLLYLLGADPYASTASPILLPSQKSGVFKFFKIPSRMLRDYLPTDAQFTKINNCIEPDCMLEQALFKPVHEDAPSETSSQDFWKYKYLLDLDGFGHNTRFVTFLRSHSLVFKAGILREWWTERVTAWKHFIPLDVRGHNIFPTLAYFKGFPATEETQELPSHEDAAQRIAEDGKRWADRVLRKEDLEIYMFRLLLEWGRITDDRRDDLGFGAKEKWWEETRVGVDQGRGDKGKSSWAKLVGG